MAGKIRLELVGGPMLGRKFEIEDHTTLIFGRQEDCHIAVPDDGGVSRHHFILEINPPDACLRDLGSTNGTYVNGRLIGGAADNVPAVAVDRDLRAELRDGDIIQVGQTTIQFKVRGNAECCVCGIFLPIAGAARTEVGGFICLHCQRVSPTLAAPSAIRLHGDTSEKVKLFTGIGGAPSHWSDCIVGHDLVRKLGSGANGDVYLARRRLDGSEVAIKAVISRKALSARTRRLFVREIQLIQSLDHENIVRFYDNGHSGNVYYFVMEYCNGGTLTDLADIYGGRLPIPVGLQAMLQALSGMAYAHGKHCVHRDLKPANILLSGPMGKQIAKIADFGLGKNFSLAGISGMTATGFVGGTPYYMPREQLTHFRDVKPTSDVWSLAATFYRVLTGQPVRPFTKGRDALEIILHEPVTPIRNHLPELAKPVAAVIDRALADDIDQRYRDAGQFRGALKAALGQG